MSPSSDMGPRYRIDLEWYRGNNCSFAALVESRLCPECQDKVKGEIISDEDLIEMFKDCCAKKADFISPNLSVLETLFRLSLGNGNQPMTVVEMSHQLRQLRMESFPLGPDVLQRILGSDGFYGLREINSSTQDESPAK